MRILCVEPGPHFSVQDVHRGWVKAFQQLGCEVVDFNFGDRLDFYGTTGRIVDGEFTKSYTLEQAARLASKGLEAAAFEVWPHVVFITSGFFVAPLTYEILRRRGITVVTLHTESPYEDDKQIAKCGWSTVNLINDPTNLDDFRAVNHRTFYVPHSYDPDVHYPGPSTKAPCDFAFVGTGYDSRVRFFEQVDWSGINAVIAGNWRKLDAGHKLAPLVPHRRDWCVDNTETADIYRSALLSANLYRTEATRPELSAGWAMGPREVELAACSKFFLRESRPEGDDLFPFLPTFSEPAEFEAMLRDWLKRDGDRDRLGQQAREAVADRTFVNRARWLLTKLS